MDTANVIQDRHDTYGDYRKQAQVSQTLQAVLAKELDRKNISSYQLESLTMICVKLSRIVCGNPYHKDSWRDIAGYAELVVKELRRDYEKGLRREESS